MKLKDKYKNQLLDYIGKIIEADHRLKYYTSADPKLIPYELSEKAIREISHEYQKLVSSLLRSVANISRDEYLEDEKTA